MRILFISLILFLIYFPAFATQQPIFAQTSNGLSTTLTVYCSPTGISTCRSSETFEVRALWPTGGIISNLFVYGSTNAGTGNSYIINVMKNGSSTFLTCSLSTSRACVDLTDSFNVSATDLLDMSVTPISSPNAQSYLKISFVFTPTIAGETVFTGGSAANAYTTSTSFTNIVGGTISGSATEANKQTIFAGGGTFKKMYIMTDTVPGTGLTRTIIFNKNTIAQALTCSTSNTTSCSDLSDSFPISPGNFSDIKYTASNGSASAAMIFGVVFVPANLGDFVINGITGGNLLPATSTEYLSPNNSNNFLSTETTQQGISPMSFVAKGFYVNFGTSPGGSASREATVRDNGVSSTLDIVLLGSTSTGNVSGILSPVTSDLLSVQVLPTGSPATSTFQYSILGNNPYTSTLTGGSTLRGGSSLS